MNGLRMTFDDVETQADKVVSALAVARVLTPEVMDYLKDFLVRTEDYICAMLPEMPSDLFYDLAKEVSAIKYSLGQVEKGHLVRMHLAIVLSGFYYIQDLCWASLDQEWLDFTVDSQPFEYIVSYAPALLQFTPNDIIRMRQVLSEDAIEE